MAKATDTTTPTRARINRNDFRYVFAAYRKNDNALFTRRDTKADDTLYNAAYDYLNVYDGEAPYMLELMERVDIGPDYALSNREAALVLNNLIRTAERQ